ncbi:MAG: DNA polymerase III subunit delta [Bacteroidales bacterium]|nr:DNA polymerase III subunit delta [Bacteroidales bacterium]
MLFKDIIGQEEIKNYLIQTVKDNRISHAQLFFGSEGCGKLALAIAYAQYINCKNRSENDSCGVCPSCIKYQKLIHPDLHFVYPVASLQNLKKPLSKDFIEKWRYFAIRNNYFLNLNEWYKEIGIEKKQGIINKDDCNNIIRTLNYMSYEAEYKVMIIWMVEKLFHSAAPKLLKILEEPPNKTLFILISENQERIINTIISRTQIIKIPKIANKVLIESLKNKTDYSESEIIRVVKIANGNYKAALRFLEQSDEEKYNFVTFRNWMRLCFLNNIVETNDFINEIARIGRERQKSFFSYSLRLIRECLMLNYSPSYELHFEGEEETFIRKFSPYVNNLSGPALSDEFNKALFHIERNANPSILFLDLSLTIIKLLKRK